MGALAGYGLTKNYSPFLSLKTKPIPIFKVLAKPQTNQPEYPSLLNNHAILHKCENKSSFQIGYARNPFNTFSFLACKHNNKQTVDKVKKSIITIECLHSYISWKFHNPDMAAIEF